MIFEAPRRILAQDVMSKNFIILKSNVMLNDAIDKMITHNNSEVFIVDTFENPIGVITLTDISKIKKSGEDTSKNVSEFINDELITISGITPLFRCRDIMIKAGVGRLPVIEANKIAGVIRNSEIRDSFYMKMEEMGLYLSNIIDSIHEALCVTDADGNVVIWNKNAEKLYGVKINEIVGKKLETFFPNAIILQVLKSKKAYDNLYHEPRKNTHVAISAIPIYKNDKFLGVVSSERDITEVKNLSEQLKKATDTLKFLEGEVQRFSNDGFGKIIGKSPILAKSVERAKQVAPPDSSILITGESGTGKEVFARAIHTNSGRSGIFVPVNCSAIPDELFESEFFGYEPGAFTGANKRGKLGIFELANNGTAFLDEIGELPLHMQAKLLRVLQEREVRRVGGEKTYAINARIISATNKDLKDMVSKGKFREDLYYRLDVVDINLPALRNRKGDIDLFIHAFFQEICQKNNIINPKIEEGLLDILRSYSWKGNVRELKNTIEHIVVLSNNNFISKASIPEYIVEAVEKDSIKKYDGNDLNGAVANLEKTMIERSLRLSGNNKVKAAKILNIKRSTLYYKMDFYNIRT